MSSEPAKPYSYKRKSSTELRAIAAGILEEYPARRINHAIDIEGILEDMGIEVLFRPIQFMPIEAYVPKRRDLIVVNELKLLSMVRYRFTLAEELAHRILENDLWEKGIPKGGRLHEFTRRQYKTVEQDAKTLAAEIIEPYEQFRERFAINLARVSESGCGKSQGVKSAIREVAKEFEVSPMSASFRARNLNLITAALRSELFPTHLM